MYDILPQKWEIETTSCTIGWLLMISKIGVRTNSILAIAMPQSCEPTIID